MVEIAICLAIIGVALVAIIGVLPLGMRTQRDNRQQTVVNQDATVILEDLRNGVRNGDDLTNYVYAISNYWAAYKNGAKQSGPQQVDGYTYASSQIYPKTGRNQLTPQPLYLTNNMNIIGVLSMPEYLDATNFQPYSGVPNGWYFSNHIVAYVRSLSGPAIEKPPQDNAIVLNNSFGYRVFCVNAPVAMDTNQLTYNQALGLYGSSPYYAQLAASLHELRLTFLWPQLPNGTVGNGRQSYRAMIAGQIMQTNLYSQWLYFYQPQTFNNVAAQP